MYRNKLHMKEKNDEAQKKKNWTVLITPAVWDSARVGNQLGVEIAFDLLSQRCCQIHEPNYDCRKKNFNLMINRLVILSSQTIGCQFFIIFFIRMENRYVKWKMTND